MFFTLAMRPVEAMTLYHEIEECGWNQGVEGQASPCIKVRETDTTQEISWTTSNGNVWKVTVVGESAIVSYSGARHAFTRFTVAGFEERFLGAVVRNWRKENILEYQTSEPFWKPWETAYSRESFKEQESIMIELRQLSVCYRLVQESQDYDAADDFYDEAAQLLIDLYRLEHGEVL